MMGYDGWYREPKRNREQSIIDSLRDMCDPVEWEAIKDKMPSELYQIWHDKKQAQSSDKGPYEKRITTGMLEWPEKTVGELVNAAYMNPPEAVELDLSEYIEIPLDEMTDDEQKNWFASVPMIDPRSPGEIALDEFQAETQETINSIRKDL